MKKVIREVKDLKPYVTKQVTCITVALIVAFFVNYIPVTLGASFGILVLFYLLFTLYAYGICLLLYALITPSYKRIKVSDFENYLVNKGEDIQAGRRIHIVPVNPLLKRARYKTKTNKGEKVEYIFDFKNNSYRKKWKY